MSNGECFVEELLGIGPDNHTSVRVWLPGPPESVTEHDGEIRVTCGFTPFKAADPTPWYPTLEVDEALEAQRHTLRLRAYGPNAVRVTFDPTGNTVTDPDHWGMLNLHETAQPVRLDVAETASGWEIHDTDQSRRAFIPHASHDVERWSDLIPPPLPVLEMTLYPDGATAVPLQSHDRFFPRMFDSMPLAFVTNDGQVERSGFSMHAEPDERFGGTGERFAKLDLSGRTIRLENRDALGNNNRRAYKNVPFYLSSRPYGLLMLTSAHAQLSLADLSTRAAQAVVEEDRLDLFLIGGGSMAEVLHGYRKLTGFPPTLPKWSYGVWMSRMSYWTADEVREMVRQMRAHDLPMDVAHLDTGWFDTDWECDWKFSKAKYPDPAAFVREMKDQGVRVSLWQHPKVTAGTAPAEIAQREGYLPKLHGGGTSSSGSNFSSTTSGHGGMIDLTNPAAAQWYRGMLDDLLALGVSVFKTDFGEDIPLDADYMNLDAAKLHNLYGLLYQRLNFDAVQEATGEGIIWARAGWTGCQRYPVHWAGDTAATWDGLAGTIRGGLHLGLSGFAYWSCDVPGFHGLPDFMNSPLPDDLYVRWTQASVFFSHFRYHGTRPREPYLFPEVLDTVRWWLKLRYALIPYLMEQAEHSIAGGLPLMRAMILADEDDPTLWGIDDQFMCGNDILVAPVMNASGERQTYLPRGQWVDAWTGEVHHGPAWQRTHSDLRRIPVFVRHGAELPLCRGDHPSTHSMDDEQICRVRFEESSILTHDVA